MKAPLPGPIARPTKSVKYAAADFSGVVRHRWGRDPDDARKSAVPSFGTVACVRVTRILRNQRGCRE